VVSDSLHGNCQAKNGPFVGALGAGRKKEVLSGRGGKEGVYGKEGLKKLGLEQSLAVLWGPEL